MKKKINIVVAGHDQKFWSAVQKELELTEEFNLKVDLWNGHSGHDVKKSQELLVWADIIVCEWALGNAVYYSKNKLQNQTLIIRLHAQEKETRFPLDIDYNSVDAMVFVSKHILDESVSKFDIPKNITHVIPNIVDVKKFNKDKFSDAEFTIGMIGTVPMIKRMDLAYETLKYLQRFSTNYKLRIKGKSPSAYTWVIGRDAEREFYEILYEKINSSDLRYKMVFDPYNDDISSWLQHVGFILSPSDRESFHVAPAEGMASSSLPIIWKRKGSSEIFPSVIKTDSPELAAQQIDFYRRSKAGERYKRISQNFIMQNFDSKLISKQWLNILKKTKEKESQVNTIDKSKKLLVFFSIGNWETFHRKEMIEALAKHIKDEYNIMIIEPGSHYKTILKQELDSKTNLDLMLELKPIQVQANIFKIRIMNAGLPDKADISKVLLKNKEYKNAIYQSLLDIFGSDTEILYWIQKPLQYKWIGTECDFIYEVYDEYTMDFETGFLNEDVLRAEDSVLPLAKHVFFTSTPLAKRKSDKTSSWSVVTNGVNFDIFSKYRLEIAVESNKRDSVGYLGNLSNFFNWELMCEVVKKMPHIDFIFFGQLELENLGERKKFAKELMLYDNTIFTRRVTREEGAVGINLVDILIIPFVINEAMHAVNPLKLWEYFCTGKPVISTPMDAVNISKPLLRVASTDKEWRYEIESALNEYDTKIMNSRISLAKQNSWNNLTLEHAKIISR